MSNVAGNTFRPPHRLVERRLDKLSTPENTVKGSRLSDASSNYHKGWRSSDSQFACQNGAGQHSQIQKNNMPFADIFKLQQTETVAKAISEQVRSMGYSSLSHAFNDAESDMKHNKDPSKFHNLVDKLSALPKKLMGVDGFDELSAAITLNDAAAQVVGFTGLVGIGAFGAFKEAKESKEELNGLLQDIADVEQELPKVTGDVQQEQALVRRQASSLLSLLSVSHKVKNISREDQQTLSDIKSKIQNSPAEQLPRCIQSYTKLQAKIAEKEIRMLDADGDKKLAVSMAGMLGAMFASVGSGGAALVASVSDAGKEILEQGVSALSGGLAETVGQLSVLLGEIAVPGIFLPANLIAARAGHKSIKWVS